MIRATHVSFYRDPESRAGRALLGAWPTLAAHAPAVMRAGVDVTVVHAAAYDEAFETDGVPFRFVRDTRSALRHPVRLLRAVRASRPQVVHVSGLGFPIETLWLRGAFPTLPAVVQDHADRPRRGVRRLLQARALDGATVAFTAQALAEPFLRAGIVRSPDRIVEVVEASSTFMPGDRGAARAASGLSGDPALLWLGRLDANKDPGTVLDAVTRLADRLPDLHLWCAWRSGDRERATRDRVAGDPRLASRVHLLGPRPHADVETLLRASDFFLQASHHEGSSFAALEAMACGTPPIVTDIPAFRALTGNGAVGALVPVGDAAGFARAIAAAWDRDRAADRMAVREHFDRYLSWDVLGARWRAIYERVLQEHTA